MYVHIQYMHMELYVFPDPPLSSVCTPSPLAEEEEVKHCSGAVAH